MDLETKNRLKLDACKVRKGIIVGVYNAKSGHPGGSLSIADIMSYLYLYKMNIDPKNPKKEDRDRFVLSKGHCAPALYSAMAVRGFFDEEKLTTLRHIGSPLQGHPSMKLLDGVEASTGSLGQGISIAVGMALGAKLKGEDYKVYAVLGDGELGEGQVWEASMFASAKKLDNLILIVDNNNLQIDGTLEEVNSPYPIPEKFKSFGFDVQEIDGHNFDQIDEAVTNAINSTNGKPNVIIAKTVKGKGVSYMENQCGWHGKAPNDEEYITAMKELEEALLKAENEVK
ncbi:MAG: transketolase [Clostridia bacterium]|nr:transketolase [Clostridia bacterium]